MDTLEDQVNAIEAANSSEAPELEPGAGEAKPASEPTPEPEAEADKPLELTEGDEAVEVDDADEGGEEAEDDEGKRRRHKPAKQRIAELTAEKHNMRRELEELRAAQAEAEKQTPAAVEASTEPPAKPDPSTFEYGESDPAYIESLTDWKLEMRDHAQQQKDAERTKADGENAKRQQMFTDLENNIAKAEETAKAKYDDFDARIAEAVENRGGEQLPPMLTVGIGVSAVGGDIMYRLATDDEASLKLETLAKGGGTKANAFAMAFGELEGEYIDSDDSDLDVADPMDMARMLGRMRTRLAGKKAPERKPVSVTNAPEPPQGRARGGAGRAKPGADTDDINAFMKEYGSNLGL